MTVSRLSHYALKIPFVTSQPLTDVKLLIVLLPLWWLLGIEQFVGPVLLSIIVVKSWLVRPYLRPTPALSFLLLFLVSQAVSAIAIDETFRFLTFARTWGTYVGAAALLIVIPSMGRTWTQVRGLLQALVAVMTMASAVGLAGILGVWRPEVTSALAAWLPRWIAESGYGGALAYRQIGAMAWFTYFGDYFRVDSFFLFSTMYAAALALTLPISIFLARTARGGMRWAFVAATALLALNLLFTTGRMAMVALVVGAAYWLVHRKSWPARAILFALAAIVVAWLGAVGDLQGSLDDALFARGTGSVESRSAIYLLTIEGVIERPLFGWGTERDVDDIAYPAGSHSHHLGVLFKFGSVGFAIYLALGIAIWSATSPRGLPQPPGTREGSEIKQFLHYARWTLVTAALVGFTSVLDLDATVALVLWVVIAAAIAARRIVTALPCRSLANEARTFS